MRTAHFFLSLGLVLFLWFVIDYRHGVAWATTDGLYWFLVGNIIYFAGGILLAIAFRDNRAFCKYLCPITVFLKFGTRLSILRISGEQNRCSECAACDRACPMGIPVSQYVLSDRAVIDTECVLCQNCVASCPEKCVTLSIRVGSTHGPLPKLGMRARHKISQPSL